MRGWIEDLYMRLSTGMRGSPPQVAPYMRTETAHSDSGPPGKEGRKGRKKGRLHYSHQSDISHPGRYIVVGIYIEISEYRDIAPPPRCQLVRTSTPGTKPRVD